MGAQLEQLLGYLDRDNVTELVIAVGRPISIKQNGAYSALTAKPLTREQLTSLFADTPIVLPVADGMQEPAEVEIARRPLRVRVGKRGDEIIVRLEPLARAPAPARSARSVVVDAIDQSTLRRPASEPVAARKPVSEPMARQPISEPAVARRPVSEPAVAVVREPATPKPAPVPAAMPTRAATPLPLELDPEPPARTKRTTIEPTELTLDELTPVARTFPELVAAARERGASDLHISSGRAVSIRAAGALIPLDPTAPPLTVTATESLLLELLGPAQHAQLASVGYSDLAVDAPGGGRLRANISRHQGGLKGTFRLARAVPASLEELGLPKDLAKVVSHHQGLVVIAGPSGHGKTTTLAALVDLINGSKPAHILTIEDPIEIVHPRKVAVVSQREAGRHTKSFATGLKASLREDPDVIVVGELRDRETVEIALTAAETGHLVLATMSTPSAAKTLDRLIDMFPPEEHSQVRATVAGALRAVVAQRLLPSADGTGVVPIVEMLTGVLPLAVLIRDDKLFQLPNLMQRGRAFGMIRFDDSLLEQLRAGKITEEVAIAAADNKKELSAMLKPQVVVPPAAAAASARSRLGAMFGGKKDPE